MGSPHRPHCTPRQLFLLQVEQVEEAELPALLLRTCDGRDGAAMSFGSRVTLRDVAAAESGTTWVSLILKKHPEMYRLSRVDSGRDRALPYVQKAGNFPRKCFLVKCPAI